MKRQTLTAFALTAALLSALVYSPYPAVKAFTPIPVTVTILKVIQVENPDGFPDGDGDYYASVNIANQGFNDNRADAVQDDEFSPYWRFTATVDRDLGTVPVDIQLWDNDGGLRFDDNLVDVSAADDTLHLTLDLNTGSWTGEVPQNVGFSTGEGDDSAKFLFDVSLSDGDFDDDGIPDAVERFGVRDGNGQLIADMANLVPGVGADPCRPTVAVEMDFMEVAGGAGAHSHRPRAPALDEVVAAFNAAPYPLSSPPPPCPYPGFPQNGGGGVNFVYTVDDALPETAQVEWGGAGSQNAEAIRNANFAAELRPYFHYALWAHDQPGANSGSSGLCCSDSKKDVLVTLGTFTDQVGDVREQSGTLMHEIGHALGLGHGGGRELDPECDPDAPGSNCLYEINCKPNYLSIMNYSFQFTGVFDPTLPANNIDLVINATGASGKDGIPDNRGRLDYSRSALPDIVETALLENGGIGDGTDITIWGLNGALCTDGAGAMIWCIAAGNGAINWNNNFNMTPAGAVPIFDASAVSVDVNSNRTDCLNPGAGETHKGYDDWRNLKFRAVLSPNVNLPGAGSDGEATSEATRAYLAPLAQALKPDPAVSITASPDPVLTGSNITYTITLRNNRLTPAENVVMTDQLPAGTAFVSCAATGGGVCGGSGSTRTAAYAKLAGGATETVTIVASVDCPVADGASLVNSVSLNSSPLDANPNNNAASAVVAASNPPPVIKNLAVSQSVLGPPNHTMRDVSVSYTVEDNCGTAAVSLNVASNEPVNGLGDGDRAPDWEVVNSSVVRLRAERAGLGTGRVYTITVTAADSAGNSSSQSITVLVPHN